MEHGSSTHVIFGRVQAGCDSACPIEPHRRTVLRLVLPRDKRFEIGRQIAAGPSPIALEESAVTAH